MQKEIKDEEPLVKKSETVKEIQYYDLMTCFLTQIKYL